jgi:hypothetical protein
VRRNPPHGKGTPHIRRITLRPNKSGEPKTNQVARLIRPTFMRLTGYIYTSYGLDLFLQSGQQIKPHVNIRYSTNCNNRLLLELQFGNNVVYENL